jgi:hypothetical protein
MVELQFQQINIDQQVRCHEAVQLQQGIEVPALAAGHALHLAASSSLQDTP